MVLGLLVFFLKEFNSNKSSYHRRVIFVNLIFELVIRNCTVLGYRNTRGLRKCLDFK
jgi:hypothetical protein